jgi:hypothetical protein
VSGGGQNKRGGRAQNSGRNSQQPKGGAKRKSRTRSRSKKVDPRKYWGDTELLDIPESFVTETPDTSVVATSLGRPPIPGQENASKHYFSLVYDRAAMLAGALAAAGDIQNMAANTETLAQELRARSEDVDDAEDDEEEVEGIEEEPEPEGTEDEEEAEGIEAGSSDVQSDGEDEAHSADDADD